MVRRNEEATLGVPAPGTTIDASNPDAWDFPVGTRFWKEFSHERLIETRLLEREDGSWRYASYVWNAGADATLAPAEGVSIPLPGGSGRTYAVPSRTDCLACHEGGVVPVLGFSALQRSPDRDPLAPHAEPDLKLFRRRLRHRDEPRTAFAASFAIDAIEHQHVKMHIEIGCGSEALDQRHAPVAPWRGVLGPRREQVADRERCSFLRWIVTTGRADCLRLLLCGKLDIEDMPALVALAKRRHVPAAALSAALGGGPALPDAYLAYSRFLNKIDAKLIAAQL